MNILITGGSGFIGSHLSEKLLDEGNNKLFLIDNLLTGSTKNIEHLLSRQTISNNKLSDAIASISTNEEEFSDEPLVIPVPQHQLTVKGGSSPKVQYIPIGSESGLNSNKITRAKLAAV